MYQKKQELVQNVKKLQEKAVFQKFTINYSTLVGTQFIVQTVQKLWRRRKT